MVVAKIVHPGPGSTQATERTRRSWSGRHTANTADLDPVASPAAAAPTREGTDRIGAVNQLRSLQKALCADLSRSASPYRQGSTVLARLLTLFVVAALVFGAIPGEDAVAQVGGFISGTIWDDTRIRNGILDDNEGPLPPGTVVTVMFERVDVPGTLFACAAGGAASTTPSVTPDATGRYRCQLTPPTAGIYRVSITFPTDEYEATTRVSAK